MGARFHPFAGLRSTITLRNGAVKARVSDLLAEASPLVLEALAEILLARIFHRRPSREARECYLAYTFRPAIRHRIDAARRERGSKRLLPARGRHHDLEEIFHGLNHRFFHGQIPPSRLGWSPKDSRRILGHYDSGHGTIIVSRKLDSPVGSPLSGRIRRLPRNAAHPVSGRTARPPESGPLAGVPGGREKVPPIRISLPANQAPLRLTSGSGKPIKEENTMARGFTSLSLATAALLLSLVPARSARAADDLTVASPDGKVVISFALKSNPQPYLPGVRAYYRVSYGGVPVLTDSPLGLDFEGAPALDHDFEITGTDRHSRDDTWTNRFGALRDVPDHYNQLRVSLREKPAPGRQVDVIFRAYNEGAAFRYFLPQQDAMEKFTLMAENTGFYFATRRFRLCPEQGPLQHRQRR